MGRKFDIQLTLHATLELDELVINSVDDEWRAAFYNLESANDIAGMIGRDMLLYRESLNDLDGFADLPDGLASITLDYEECAVTEDHAIQM